MINKQLQKQLFVLCKLAFGLALLFVGQVNAQLSLPPKGYFLFPIEPGMTNELTGNFPELRSNHFHGGLDIRTKFKSGLPVYASADGYVSRIEVNSHSYGWRMDVTHPNGFVTVYAHLSEFRADVADWIKREQYKQQEWSVELSPAKNQFPVKRGEIIATSGNTGSSAGPHLHWELRDSSQNYYNGLLLGFNEIKDRSLPYFVRVNLKPLSLASRINGKFDKYTIPFKKQGSKHFAITKPDVYGTFGLELYVRDRMDKGTSRCSVKRIIIKLDELEIYSHDLSQVSYAQSKQINNHLVYEHWITTGEKTQKGYLADGDVLRKGKSWNEWGIFNILDQRSHKLKIDAWDAYGNHAHWQGQLLGTGQPIEPVNLAGRATSTEPDLDYKLVDNTLKLKADASSDGSKLTLHFVKGGSKVLNVNYLDGAKEVYLWDMRQGVPSMATRGEYEWPFTFRQGVLPGRQQHLAYGPVDLHFTEKSLFDTLWLGIDYDTASPTFKIAEPTIPLQEAITVSYGNFHPLTDKARTAVYLKSGGIIKHLGGKWVGDQIQFKTKTFGQFTLVTDTKPPVLRPIQVSNQSIRAIIGDNLSGIASWRATVDGKLLLMGYEHKQNLIYSILPPDTTRLTGEVVIELFDMAGNRTEYKTRL